VSIEVSCDCCGITEEVQLLSLAKGCWDERNIAACLTQRGWLVDGNNHYCEECKLNRT